MLVWFVYRAVDLLRGEKSMKRGKLIIFMLTVLLAAIAVVFGKYEVGMRNFPFSVMVTSDGIQEELYCLKIADEYYMFLPSYAEADKLRICTNPVYDVYLDGQQLVNNQPLPDLQSDTKLELYFHSLGNEGYETVTFVRSRNVATMHLNFPSGGIDYIHEEKDNEESASVHLYTKDGVLDYVGFAESVKSRGNALWEEEKKAYSLQLFGEADLLKMGKAQRWILLANAYDSSHIRNKVVYDAAAAVGLPFSPESNWVDLYVNGEYRGLYQLSERNEIHPERVDIPKESGFLIAQDFLYNLIEQGYPHVVSENGIALRVYHSSSDLQELKACWQSVENAVLAEDGIDPVTGKSLEELIDLDSWIHKYLLEELFANHDAGFGSQFYFCDTSESAPKLYAGPIWDFDISMGNGGLMYNNPRSFVANRMHYVSLDDVSLFYHLYQKDIFYNRMVQLFESVYEPLITDLVDNGIQNYADSIAQAVNADRHRWYRGGSRYDVTPIVNFLRERLECFHELWIDRKEYCMVEILDDEGLCNCWLVPKGDCLPELLYEETDQWSNTITGEMIDITQPILENIRIQPMPQ